MILGDPATADFDNLNDKFVNMNLSAKKYDLDSVKLNDSDLETPYFIVKKRKLHEMLEDADNIPIDEISFHKNKRSIYFDFKDNELVSFSKEKRTKFVKREFWKGWIKILHFAIKFALPLSPSSFIYYNYTLNFFKTILCSFKFIRIFNS